MKESILPFGVAFCVSLLFHPRWIAYLSGKALTQQVRPEGPGSHRTKELTPTLGGVGILLALLVGLIPVAASSGISPGGGGGRLLSLLALVLGCGAVGFADDWLQLKRRQSLGLKARHKLLLLLLVGGVFLVLYLPGNPGGSVVGIPDLFEIGRVHEVNFGGWFIPFFLVTLLATTNAVNLTDGQDGLAAGTVLAALWYFVGGFARLPAVEGFVWSLIGSCLGFLWFNSYPARIFMGDTGSLLLGGALTGLATNAHHPFMLLWVGGIFVAEALSVILQVIYFKSTGGKRIFKMSPLHHHFELSGIHESQVTVRFWIAGILLAFTGATCYPAVAW